MSDIKKRLLKQLVIGLMVILGVLFAILLTFMVMALFVPTNIPSKECRRECREQAKFVAEECSKLSEKDCINKNYPPVLKGSGECVWNDFWNKCKKESQVCICTKFFGYE